MFSLPSAAEHGMEKLARPAPPAAAGFPRIVRMFSLPEGETPEPKKPGPPKRKKK